MLGTPLMCSHRASLLLKFGAPREGAGTLSEVCSAMRGGRHSSSPSERGRGELRALAPSHRGARLLPAAHSETRALAWPDSCGLISRALPGSLILPTWYFHSCSTGWGGWGLWRGPGAGEAWTAEG